MSLIKYYREFCVPYLRAALVKDEKGASLVEYALLLALIAVVAITIVTALGGKVSAKFSQTSSALS